MYLIRAHFKEISRGLHESFINDAYAIFVADCLYKSIRCVYSFELPQLVEAIQMSMHSVCFYNEVDTNKWTVASRL